MNLLDIKQVFSEKNSLSSSVAKEVRRRFPDAKIKLVESHWQIPEIHGNQDLANERYVRVKKNYLILGEKKKLYCRENGRSTDFIAPSHSNGCAMACAYCYVQRRKGLTNPITVFTNIDEILQYTVDHAREQGTKKTPNQCDPHLWTYDIGENCDCSVDDLVSDNVQKFIETFRSIPNSKACFATKFVNRNLLNYDPQGHTRIRFSVMPERTSSILDVRTSPMQERIDALDDFVEAGYEVHLNISPIIVYKQDGYDWRDDYRELFQRINDSTSQKFKDQVKAEVIFMTHNEDMHNLNLQWHPKAEDYLWKPTWQEPKISQTGGKNIRYQYQLKRKMIDAYKQIHQEMVPYMDIRYIF